MQSHQIPQNVAMFFVLAGNATLTFKSTVTGKHFTYKIKKSKERENVKPVWFVSLLTGCNNETDYTYFGYIKEVDKKFVLFHGKDKTKISDAAPGFIAFKFLFEHFVHSMHMNDLEIWHEGLCCRCGRKLTDPLSVELGIGPECRGKFEKKGIVVDELFNAINVSAHEND